MNKVMRITLNDPDGMPTGEYKTLTIRIGRLWIMFHWCIHSKPTVQEAENQK